MDQAIDKFIRGTQFVNIVCAVKEEDLTKAKKVSDKYLEKKCVKFIPASGAATRMFKDLYNYLDDHVETSFISRFFEHIEVFPFYQDIKGDIEAKGLTYASAEDKSKVIELILNDPLNYGHLPKALIKMHAYGDLGLTPIDEHIYEGEQYLNKDAVKCHFTISKEHKGLFDAYVASALAGKQEVTIEYSYQKEQTDTLAVDMDNKPFIDDQGDILYRAGGHGSLIENLNDLKGDIIFIKNIDNVCHKNQVKATIDSKKILASIGFEVKEQIDHYIASLLSDTYNLDEIASFIKETLNIVHKKALTKDLAFSLLNRPLRVCGMVKNQGEPGGGPFVVDNGDYLDLQICEMSEINVEDEKVGEILNASQFFNPVDLICYVKDYKDDKFNLLAYTNQDRYFISEKTYKGRKLKALEHPGLWNGAMHHWNTLFVEVPLSTFNPVKSVNDLLRAGHRDDSFNQ